MERTIFKICISVAIVAAIVAVIIWQITDRKPTTYKEDSHFLYNNGEQNSY